MVAKNDVAHRGLVEQLMDKTVKRKYTALVHGNILMIMEQLMLQ